MGINLNPSSGGGGYVIPSCSITVGVSATVKGYKKGDFGTLKPDGFTIKGNEVLELTNTGGTSVKLVLKGRCTKDYFTRLAIGEIGEVKTSTATFAATDASSSWTWTVTNDFPAKDTVIKASFTLTDEGIGEAPNDGKEYARKSLAWTEIIPTFLKLKDTPAVFTGHAGKVARVNANANALEFHQLTAADVGARPATWVPNWADIINKPAIPAKIADLTDVGAYSAAGQVPVVNAGKTALEFKKLTPTDVGARPAGDVPWGEVSGKPDLVTETADTNLYLRSKGSWKDIAKGFALDQTGAVHLDTVRADGDVRKIKVIYSQPASSSPHDLHMWRLGEPDTYLDIESILTSFHLRATSYIGSWDINDQEMKLIENVGGIVGVGGINDNNRLFLNTPDSKKWPVCINDHLAGEDYIIWHDGIDAPKDTKEYVRKNGAWVQASASKIRTVAGESPDGNGNISLKIGNLLDVGTYQTAGQVPVVNAQVNKLEFKTLTAADVKARPDNWVPRWADIPDTPTIVPELKQTDARQYARAYDNGKYIWKPIVGGGGIATVCGVGPDGNNNVPLVLKNLGDVPPYTASKQVPIVNSAGDGIEFRAINWDDLGTKPTIVADTTETDPQVRVAGGWQALADGFKLGKGKTLSVTVNDGTSDIVVDALHASASPESGHGVIRLGKASQKSFLSIEAPITALSVAYGKSIYGYSDNTNTAAKMIPQITLEGGNTKVGHDSGQVVVNGFTAAKPPVVEVENAGSRVRHKIWHDGLDAPKDGVGYVRKNGAWAKMAGGGSVVSVCGVDPDVNGNVALKIANITDVGAYTAAGQVPVVNAGKNALEFKTLTAADVGARPAGNVPWADISGKPTIPAKIADLSDVGAYSAAGQVAVVNAGVDALEFKKLTAADVGARPSSWVPAWGDITGKPTIPAKIADLSDVGAYSVAGQVPVVNAGKNALEFKKLTAADVGARPAGNVPWADISGKPVIIDELTKKDGKSYGRFWDATNTKFDWKEVGGISDTTEATHPQVRLAGKWQSLREGFMLGRNKRLQAIGYNGADTVETDLIWTDQNAYKGRALIHLGDQSATGAYLRINSPQDGAGFLCNSTLKAFIDEQNTTAIDYAKFGKDGKLTLGPAQGQVILSAQNASTQPVIQTGPATFKKIWHEGMEAPNDGKTYGRRNKAWHILPNLISAKGSFTTKHTQAAAAAWKLAPFAHWDGTGLPFKSVTTDKTLVTFAKVPMVNAEVSLDVDITAAGVAGKNSVLKVTLYQGSAVIHSKEHAVSAAGRKTWSTSVIVPVIAAGDTVKADIEWVGNDAAATAQLHADNTKLNLLMSVLE